MEKEKEIDFVQVINVPTMSQIISNNNYVQPYDVIVGESTSNTDLQLLPERNALEESKRLERLIHHSNYDGEKVLNEMSGQQSTSSALIKSLEIQKKLQKGDYDDVSFNTLSPEAVVAIPVLLQNHSNDLFDKKMSDDTKQRDIGYQVNEYKGLYDNSYEISDYKSIYE